MPTYEYECLECKHRFDVFQSMMDDPIDNCEKCCGKVRKLIGAGAGIIFKGSGFYVNDYKKKEHPKEKKGIPGNNKTVSGNKDAVSSSSKEKVKESDSSIKK